MVAGMSVTLPQGAYKEIFYKSTAAMLIIGNDSPHYTMLDVNDAYLKTTYTRREDIIGKPVFGVFPANPTDNESRNVERTIYSFEQAIATKITHVMSNYRYDIPVPGTMDFEERYWTSSNSPVLDDKGNVAYFIHSPHDVTQLYQITEKEKAGVEALRRQQEQLYSIFMQAPVGIAIVEGAEYRVTLINGSMAALYHKSKNELLGKPIFDVLVHARGRGFEELLARVMETGEPFRGYGLPLVLERMGETMEVFVDFVYEPFRNMDGVITGVIAIAIEVTNQVRGRKQLSDAEERARLAADVVGLGTFDLDLLSGEMITTERFAHIFGFDRPVSRKDYIAVMHPEDMGIRQAAHEAALATGKLEYEARVIWKDQSVYWVRVEGRVIYDEKEKPIRILGTLLDITEQRIAKEEQQKLRSLVDNSVDLIALLNMDGFNIYLNEAGKKLLGFEHDEQVKHTHISALHPPEEFALVENDVLPSTMQKGKWAGIMMVRHLGNAEVFPVFNNCFRIDDPVTGLPIAIGAVMRDLRPELAAKQALANSEQLLKNITTAAPITLWMADENGANTYVNQTWADWTGNRLEENMGVGWLTPVLAEDREKTENSFQDAFRRQKNFDAEFRIHHVDGTIHWCHATGKPYNRNDGSFAGYIGACIDITEQKHMQQQKDDFIGIASHELKTPVTSIKGYTQILERMLTRKGQDQEAAMMARMNVQINRLNNLIGDLLDVTKISAGKLQFNDVDFDFYPMVKELVEDLRLTTDQHELEEMHTGSGTVHGDRDRIRQVITNLVTNAIKYSPKATKIIIHCSLEHGEVVLCVQDFGIGIPKEKQEKVFEQFYRVSGDLQHTFPGLGLGLYISSEIIKREGGKIWVNSNEGEGSTFCFSLPVIK